MEAGMTTPSRTAHSTVEGILPLFWLFVIGSVAGLAIETVYHAIAFGGYEDRAGLVCGPFSPIYGTGAVMLTIVANCLTHANSLAVFGMSALVGSAVEFATSWLMEVLFGAIAWDYSGTFGNIDGRVNLAFALMWGTLGLAWTRIVMPLMSRTSQRIDWRSTAVRALSIASAVFMVLNIALTVQALARESARMDHVPPATPIDHFLDQQFPSTWMQNRFENMSIYGSTLRERM
ncbi:putative ABC transporter permease [Raoultibacter phocaeensis]|uniref:putative ABC transporter permease n=1 Tax=Raoultibacter phocaeensis TaxID=2479841 RepID=UPI0021035E1F|nr:putative ABC transporter permease [Raoultibacter phocaeensis]